MGIFAEGKTHALAVGKTLMSTTEIRNLTVDNHNFLAEKWFKRVCAKFEVVNIYLVT